jgi:hypothetical protein
MISDTYNGKFVHANDIVYRVDGAIKVGYACAFVPLDGNEMKNGEKKYVRKKLGGFCKHFFYSLDFPDCPSCIKNAMNFHLI